VIWCSETAPPASETDVPAATVTRYREAIFSQSSRRLEHGGGRQQRLTAPAGQRRDHRDDAHVVIQRLPRNHDRPGAHAGGDPDGIALVHEIPLGDGGALRFASAVTASMMLEIEAKQFGRIWTVFGWKQVRVFC
jgi:hypothetical protein